MADPAEFRRVLGHFCSGIVLVSALEDGRPVGMTCQAFTSLSLDPPLIAVAAARTSTTYPRIRRAGVFSVCMLGEQCEQLARVFGTSGIDKFADVSWHTGPRGTPIVDDSIAWLECRLSAEHDGGDHFLTVAEVLAMGHAPQAAPLVFYRGAFSRLVPSFQS